MATIDTHPEPTLIRLIKDLRDDTFRLFRQEVALAKREIAGKFFAFGKNTAFLCISASVGLYSLFFVFLFLNNLVLTGLEAGGFSTAVASWFAPLIVAMVLGVGALLFALKALRAMRREKLLPAKTMATLHDDKEWVRRKMKG